ncbi:hypothetical protein ACIQWA_37610 [Kitasatospora sp. NPDC098652]|uniref:hypothetical protein n=1 Tax=Kitasatospora sp. NPDC098652 TaxID=3364095 RepID=UPI0038147E07
MEDDKDGENGERARAPMVWALAVREVAQGPPFAELIVEVGPDLYPELVEAALDSGFTLAAGEPPDTSAVVEVDDGRVKRLALVGGRQNWEPDTRVETSPAWLSAAEDRGAAEGRGAAVVILVPPDTWPPGLIELGPVGLDVFAQRLEQERRAGHVLHGTASVQVGGFHS